MFVITALWLRIGLSLVAVAVSVHLLSLKTLTKGMLNPPRSPNHPGEKPER
ncbi:MAG: hypothetical protein JXD23_02175 [Spirochaetales bacterium]|nr:hypothetical protein [Spirochaetales bacterium]